MHSRTNPRLPLAALSDAEWAVLAPRLGLPSALPAPPWLLPDPDLSEAVHRVIAKFLKFPNSLPPLWPIATCRRLPRVAGGRVRPPRCLEPA